MTEMKQSVQFTIARNEIPDYVEFRGYDYTMHSIHREGGWLAHIDNAEDNARIEAMHIRREGGRACVKRFHDDKFDKAIWVVYWR